MMSKSVFVCALLAFGTAMGSAKQDDSSDPARAVSLGRLKDIFEAWLPPHLTASQKETLLGVLKARKSYDAQPYDIEGGLRCVRRHYGHFTPFTLLGLGYVRGRVGPSYLPKVLDLGAGDGHHAGLLVLAGGHVTLIENDPSLVNMKTKKNVPGQTLVKMLRGSLPEGVQTKDRTRIIVEDASLALNVPAHRAQYDFANVANVLHTMAPSQATACVKGLYNALKPGGVAHVRVQTLGAIHAATDQDVFQVYCGGVEKGVAFPGWMGLTSYQPLFFADTHLESLPEDSDRTPMESRSLRVETPKGPLPGSASAIFAFDAATLTRLFEGAGFESEDMRFEMLDGSLVPVAPGQETFVDALKSPQALSYNPLLRTSYGATNLCYIARKPL